MQILNQAEQLATSKTAFAAGDLLLTQTGLIAVDHEASNTLNDFWFVFASECCPDDIIEAVENSLDKVAEQISSEHNGDQQNTRNVGLRGCLRIVIEFQISGQGQGYSIPTALRPRLLSDVRFYASGKLIPEQANMLLACGFEGVLIESTQLQHHGIENWQNAAKSHVSYGYGR